MQINHRIFDLEIRDHKLNETGESYIDFTIGGSSGFEGYNKNYRLLFSTEGTSHRLNKVLHSSSLPCFMCAGGYSCPPMTKRKTEVFAELYPQLDTLRDLVASGNIVE
ncbi:hypothetical protein [Tumebacillus permanentifrigoris]|uniref:Uncharacterized protein n=1 Tax=Tumebacillus permanentifrigoris TaxID=378543 RepID=A0A316D614_9BACL|nr:hypothetical protein [Tumebacillus permanentifrigoris]PWK07018.1 hypothetical protein C7459_11888 [Tumebacillus permanentifrigoris]